MSANIAQRSIHIRERNRSKAKLELTTIGETNWRGMVSNRDHALDIAIAARKQIDKLIDSANKPIQGGKEFQEAHEVFANTQLDIAETILDRNSTAEIRIAQLQGLQASVDHQRAELEQISTLSPAESAKKLKEFTSKAKAASKLLRDAAGDPLGYYNIAEKFITGKVATKIPNVITTRLPSVPSTNQFIEFLKKQGADFEDFLKAKAFFEKATKFFGVAQIGLALVTIVFETLSNKGQWATKIASATAAAASGVALGAIVTGTTMSAVISATLSAAGITAEVPPLAAAIIAAGVVIVASLAIVALFDSLLKTIFGKQGIPRSMRLSMSTQMYTDLSPAMASKMSISMVSLPR